MLENYLQQLLPHFPNAHISGNKLFLLDNEEYNYLTINPDHKLVLYYNFPRSYGNKIWKNHKRLLKLVIDCKDLFVIY